MDICHLKNAELQSKYQEYRDRDVLRVDIAKNDSDSIQCSQCKNRLRHHGRSQKSWMSIQEYLLVQDKKSTQCLLTFK